MKNQEKALIVGGTALAMILLASRGAPSEGGLEYHQDLVKGWNDNVVYRGTTKPIRTALNDIITLVIKVWYDVGDGTWLLYSALAPATSDLTRLIQGESYYIETTQDCIWTMK